MCSYRLLFSVESIGSRVGVGVTVVLLDADVCLADSTGTVVCNDHGEEKEDEERGETESYMVSTGSEKETFFLWRYCWSRCCFLYDAGR